MECIVLAGGLGTRLRSVIGATPKCMATVAGVPFLFHLLNYLKAQGISRVILSLGYKHELITEHPQLQDYTMAFAYAIESEPLGTGGGIRLAMEQAREEQVFVVNGDTLFAVDMQSMYQQHETTGAQVTLGLKAMQDFDRYGSVEIDEQRRITAFREKYYRAEGFINGGVYLIQRSAFLEATKAGTFSFEQDYLQQRVASGSLYGFCSSSYFIDIGIPSDFAKAQIDFAKGLSKEGQ